MLHSKNNWFFFHPVSVWTGDTNTKSSAAYFNCHYENIELFRLRYQPWYFPDRKCLSAHEKTCCSKKLLLYNRINFTWEAFHISCYSCDALQLRTRQAPCKLPGCAKPELFALHKYDNTESAYQLIVTLRQALFTSYYIDVRTIDSSVSHPFKELGPIHWPLWPESSKSPEANWDIHLLWQWWTVCLFRQWCHIKCSKAHQFHNVHATLARTNLG